jgi:hypothetical protein
VKRKGRELVGVKTYMLGEHIIITVDTKKATFQDKPYLSLDWMQKQNYDDLLYIAHVQTGNPLIRYT